MSGPDPEVAASGGGLSSASTRAFLFADLRGYTRFAEDHGAAAAADLLERYRRLVRGAVSRFAGAEIRTEGDSFYVVFYSVSSAIGCALAIAEAAAAASDDQPEAPIQVGVGIHAGETVEADGDFVGSPVNVAARLCSLAGPGEVLVSDTVRSLTQAVVPVTFESRGRRNVKGITEAISVYSVESVEAGGDAWQSGARSRRARRTRRRRIVVAAAGITGLAVLGAAAFVALRPPPALPPGPWTIGVDVPLSGPYEAGPVRDAVQLAVDEANARGDLGVELRLDARDHGSSTEPSGLDGDSAMSNVAGLGDDPRVLAVVGPYSSGVAELQIPITNEAGLLQCSPSATSPTLTRPAFGGPELRSAAPDRVSFVRTAPSDDILATASASFVYNDLGIKDLLVIDDTDEGRLSADAVSEAFEALGGTVTRRALNPGGDAAEALQPLQAGSPTAVFFGGYADTGATDVRQALLDGGHADVPFVAWDWIQEPVDAPGSYLDVLREAAVGTFAAHASFAPPRAAFVEAFRSKHGAEPGEYEAAAYACAEVIIAALRDITPKGVTETTIREALRAHVVDPSQRFDTVLGTLGFDANGDSTQQFVTISRVDPDADQGNPGWVSEVQHDYGPAR